MGEMRIIGRSSTVMVGDIIEGDIKITWSKDNSEEIALAEKIFKEYIDKGWFAIGEALGKKTQIFKFNPEFDRIILAPLNMGG